MPHRLVTVGYVGVILAGGWALNHASTQRSEQKLRSSENACLAIGNPARALGMLEARGEYRGLHERFEPILNCHATYFTNSGRPVPLRLNQQRLYVEWVRRGSRPVIRADGTVTPR